MQIGFLYDDFDEVFNGFKVSAGTPMLLILCILAGIGIGFMACFALCCYVLRLHVNNFLSIKKTGLWAK